jgi:hypothetical protein
MNNFAAIKTAWIFSALFLLLIVLGFISDLLPKESTFLKTNTIFNIVHLITIVGFISVTYFGTKISIQFIQMSGIIYMLVSVTGFMGMNIQTGSDWTHVINLNLMNYIQFGLGVALSICGTILNNRQRLISA